jgi:thiol-disulfide isomerase/thioredoxin
MRHIRTLLWVTLFLFSAGTASAQPFVFKDMQGQAQRLQDYRGKWVLINFWATWCAPCLEEVPDLVSLYEAHKRIDLVVIGVALDSTEKSVKEFVAKRNVSYPVVVGNYDLAAQVGDVGVLPTSYLYNPQGELVSFQEGLVSRKSIEAYIKNKK